MNERKRMPEEKSADETSHSALEERLRSMYAALYPPTFPPTKPSESLRRRVAKIAIAHAARPARPSVLARLAERWRGAPVEWRLASIGAISAVLLLLGYALVQPEAHRSPKLKLPY